MSESKYKDAWKKGFDSGVESQRLSCIYECNKEYDEYKSGYDKGRADGYSQAENNYHIQTEKDRQSSYNCGYQQGAREFAEWLPQHFDLRFSNNPSVWLDEFFNHTRDKVLADVQKGAEQ